MEWNADFLKKMYLLNKNKRLALATVMLEGSVTNERLQELTDQHPRDITFLLKKLVKKGFLAARNKGRWSSYTPAPRTLPRNIAAYPIRAAAYHIRTAAYHIRRIASHIRTAAPNIRTAAPNIMGSRPRRERTFCCLNLLQRKPTAPCLILSRRSGAGNAAAEYKNPEKSIYFKTGASRKTIVAVPRAYQTSITADKGENYDT